MTLFDIVNNHNGNVTVMMPIVTVELIVMCVTNVYSADHDCLYCHIKKMQYTLCINF